MLDGRPKPQLYRTIKPDVSDAFRDNCLDDPTTSALLVHAQIRLLAEFKFKNCNVYTLHLHVVTYTHRQTAPGHTHTHTHTHTDGPNRLQHPTTHTHIETAARHTETDLADLGSNAAVSAATGLCFK